MFGLGKLENQTKMLQKDIYKMNRYNNNSPFGALPASKGRGKVKDLDRVAYL